MSESPTTSRSIAWLKLLRLPNVFTAAADVMMGYLVTHGSLEPAAYSALLIVASCALYLSGMVLNDVFDADVDAQEQPSRPIPSGRIAKRHAGACGTALLATGLLTALLVSYLAKDWRPGAIALLLGAAIIAYDKILKSTPIAPIMMGTCRALNVVFGMSLATTTQIAASADGDIRFVSPYIQWNSHAAWLIAVGIGLYIAGVTWFSRTDTRTSNRGQLVLGFSVMLTGIGLLFLLPGLSGHSPPLRVRQLGWQMLWATLAVFAAHRCVLAIAQPSPARVQSAVRNGVQMLIVLDAALCVGYASPYWGLMVLSLLLPTLLLTKWLQAT